MNFRSLKQVKDARYYAVLNLLKSEIDGSTEAGKKVQKAYRLLMTHAHADKGGSNEWAAQVNAAKQCLLDPKNRQEYNEALERFGLSDGQKLDPDFEETIKKKINPAAPTEDLEATDLSVVRTSTGIVEIVPEDSVIKEQTAKVLQPDQNVTMA